MRFLCWIGLHNWEKVDYYHRPDWHDLREYGVTICRCAHCRIRRDPHRRLPKARHSGIRIETGGCW